MFKATKHTLTAIALLAAALAIAAPACAMPTVDPGANATNPGVPPTARPCMPFCLQAPDPVAKLRFNRPPTGQAPAAELGFSLLTGQATPAKLRFENRPTGQTPAAEPGFSLLTGQATPAKLRFEHRPTGRAPAAELGFSLLTGQATPAKLRFENRPTGQTPAAEVRFSLLTGQATPAALVFNVGNPPSSRSVADSSTGSLASSTASAPGGFHWGDAGIGAGSSFPLTVLLLGAAGIATRLRRRRSSVQPMT